MDKSGPKGLVDGVDRTLAIPKRPSSKSKRRDASSYIKKTKKPKSTGSFSEVAMRALTVVELDRVPRHGVELGGKEGFTRRQCVQLHL